MSDQKKVAEFMENAGQDVAPILNIAVSDEDCILKAKLILEETLETIYALGVDVNLNFKQTNGRIITTDDVDFTKVRPIDIVEIVDGSADIHYINLGIANTFGFELQKAFNEVHRSNMSKFIDGHRREDGKWIKGPSYSPADIPKILNIK